MSGLRTLLRIAAVIVASFQVAAAASPLPEGSQDQVQVFATCAGRLSALMEHQWMFDGAGSENTKVQFLATVDLLNATLPIGMDAQVMFWRIEAKAAQRTLLWQTTAINDPARSRFAIERSAELLTPCIAMLLGQ